LSDYLPYGRQAIDVSDVAAVSAALADPFITQGPRVESFERAFADYLGARHAVAFANGTAALHAAAHAAGLGPGDELLTSPVSFVASANCGLFVGARPLFWDIDEQTANLDLAGAAAAGLAARAKACVAVSLAGLPIDLRPLQAARRHGLVVIEDACHALGAQRDGVRVGGDGLADMTTFSFHPVKAITTGEGGMVSTDSDRLAEALRAFRNHGIRRHEHPEDPLRGGWHYDVELLGFNYRITDFQCALGESQLARLEERVEQRNRIAERYRLLLSGIESLQLPAAAPAAALHAYHLFVVRFSEGAARRRAAYEHLRDLGIGAQLHYIPIPVHSLYRSLGYTMRGLRAAQSYYEQALSLPIFPGMSEADVDGVADAVRGALAVPLPGAPTRAAAPAQLPASAQPPAGARAGARGARPQGPTLTRASRAPG
jgi:perosamine synthetase